MFSFFEGLIEEKNEDAISINCNGVGYEIFISKRFKYEEEKKIKVYTQLIHKEDSMVLYGFNTREEKKMFSKLISASGVGPKLAMEIISTYSINEIMHILFNQDINLLKKVPGMGLKKAEKLLFELRDKIKKIDINITQANYNENESDAIKALISLGFSNNEAIKALSKIEDKKTLNTEELISLALKNLSIV